jgi:ATP adenylyltransferase
METHADVRPDVSRFSSLLAEPTCPRPIYDQVLMETHGCVVTPTLGSILPNWLLVVPRTQILNFLRWQAASRVRPIELVSAILSKYDIANSRAIWFEHGPSHAGSSLGCGVDQAHLHVIVDAPFAFQDFAAEIKRAGAVAWERGVAATIHGSVDPDASYLIAASMDRAIVAQNVESLGSQFFRRVIASLADEPDHWNYRTYPHLENVRTTIRRFGGQGTRDSMR